MDDILVYSKRPMDTVDGLKKHYVLKGIGKPEYYLGGNVEDLDEKYWIDQPGAPVAKLSNEKPAGQTVAYDDLVKRWAEAK